MLVVRAFGGLAFLMALIGVTLFVAAGELNYWQSWVYLAVFGVSILAITLYLMVSDRALLERRVKAGPIAEKQTSQKLFQLVAGLAFLGIFVVAGLDHRLGWTRVSTGTTIIGDLLVSLGLLIVFFVFKENAFASGTIEVAPDQRVISTGPYRIVRHPMYSGAMIMLVGVPLALGSRTALLLVIPLTAVLVARLLAEEHFLARDLPSYDSYRARVRKRLVPFLW